MTNFECSLDLRLSIPVIADAIGVNSRQIKYFMKNNGISSLNRKFSVISEAIIDEEVSKSVTHFPNAGKHWVYLFSVFE